MSLANRTASVTDSGLTTSYAYDGDGVRLAASSWASAVDYLWDGNAPLPQLALERDGGTVVRSDLYGDGPVSTSTGGVTSYLHGDAIGSVRSVTSAAGGLAWSYSYEPFGTTRSATRNDPSAPDNPIGFAGEYLDQTGLYHLRARQYDSATGRFTTTDPLVPSQAHPFVASYIYADNQPTVLIDPSGLKGVWSPRVGPTDRLPADQTSVGAAVLKTGVGASLFTAGLALGVLSVAHFTGCVGSAVAFGGPAAVVLPVMCVKMAGVGLAGGAVMMGLGANLARDGVHRR